MFWEETEGVEQKHIGQQGQIDEKQNFPSFRKLPGPRACPLLSKGGLDEMNTRQGPQDHPGDERQKPRPGAPARIPGIISATSRRRSEWQRPAKPGCSIVPDSFDAPQVFPSKPQTRNSDSNPVGGSAPPQKRIRRMVIASEWAKGGEWAVISPPGRSPWKGSE